MDAFAQGVGTITTVAGSGLVGFGGEGGPATAARLNNPRGVAVDLGGNLIIADRDNHRVRNVSGATGIITTIAGTGVPAFGGDGGPATMATLNLPRAVAVDLSSNLYIADSGNHRVRKVAARTGTITTIAGTGVPGFSSDGGPATGAALNDPRGLVLDARGNLFIADQDNHRVRKVDAGTGVITTIAGTGSPGFGGDGGPAAAGRLSSPRGVAVDAAGNIFIADQDNHRVRRVDAGTGVITTIAGTGSPGFGGDGAAATSAPVNSPSDIALDVRGNLFVADMGNQRVRKVDLATGIISTVAGIGLPGLGGDGGPATNARLNSPGGLAIDLDGNLFVVDEENQLIRKVAAVAAGACPAAPVAAGSSLTVNPTRARAGDSVAFSVGGTSGETAVAAYSRASAGSSYRGLALSLGPDLGLLFACRIPGTGACAQSVTVSVGVTGLFFFQAARSSDPTFQAGTLSLTNGACLAIQ